MDKINLHIKVKPYENRLNALKSDLSDHWSRSRKDKIMLIITFNILCKHINQLCSWMLFQDDSSTKLI